MTLSKRVREAIDAMVYEAVDRKVAAERVGLSDVSLRLAFTNPVVVAHYNATLEALRQSERAKGLHTAAAIRDDDALKLSPAGQKVRLDAVKTIEGRDGPRITINNSNIAAASAVAQQPGYVVRYDPYYLAQMSPKEQAAAIKDMSGAEILAMTPEQRRSLDIDVGAEGDIDHPERSAER